MSGLFKNPLTDLIEYSDLRRDLEMSQGPFLASGCLDTQKAHLISELSDVHKWNIVVTSDEQHARELTEDLRAFLPDVIYYPARDLLFYNSDIHGNLITKERIRVLKLLAEADGGTVVTTVDALMDHVLPFETLMDHALTIKVGAEVDVNELLVGLVSLGYEKVSQVDGSGQFSLRGGIVDIFPLTEPVPYRIELWGDEVDSIRTFDPESQRSIEQVDEALIYPATEMVLDRSEIEKGMKKIEAESKKQVKALREEMKTEQAWRLETSVAETLEGLREGFKIHGLESYIRYFCSDTASWLDYFPEAHRTVFIDDPVHLKEKAETTELEFRESMVHRLESGYLLPGQANFLYSAAQTLARLQKSNSVVLQGIEQKIPGISVKKKYSFNVKSVNSYKNGFDLLIGDLASWKKKKYRVVLLTGSRTRASRLANDLRDYELSAFCPDEGKDEVQPGEIMVTYGTLHRGFEYPLIKFVVITEGDMFGGLQKKKRAKKNKEYSGKKILSFSELSVGDYVVHETHGLGVYRGIEQIEQDKIRKDYIKIEYRDGGNLYVPATRLEGIQKYAGSDAKTPKLNKLGGAEWEKTKTRVKSAVQNIAKELVELYAKRQAAKGYQYGPDTVWQREFEELFPFDETDDQLDAINDTKRDMESTKIMDRLICGDVGYGKTEIALRAAFKAVQEGKQVVYLVPTTILAQQHYNTFVQRMKDYPVTVEMLSRFRTPSEVKKVADGLKRGMVDIVIGTHKVLSKDITFKNLGLLVIDEEQRFGVTHKEKIKQLKENIDVLTLTATPIPRTLHMSLVGIRDMSVLEEPPVDRLPIQTYVLEYNEEMVREAINREIARGGQVYYIYNRVNNIEEIANRVQQLVPEANVTFAHGQMRERDLENIMMDFVNGDIDVLVSTTIIETGLDIPNANTIIIHDADRLGLSQLYQIRGRVGRSSRTSYAFLMYRRDRMLKEEAEKRLQAIREFTELGSGIKIAMRDLELRGAGNVLGAEQHGHMDAVGYDLYCKLLNEAVLALKGDIAEEEYDTEVECEIDAYIPSTYIKNEYQKLDVYKRISTIADHEEYMDMQDELMDRFGDLPKPVENLLLVADVRALAHKIGVTVVRANTQEITIKMYPKAKIDVAKIPAVIEEYGGALKFRTGTPPAFVYTERKKNNDVKIMLNKALEIMKKFE